MRIYRGATPVTRIILHCAAINTGHFDNMTKPEVMAEITRWHKARGFQTIGYHFVIFQDGEVLEGRSPWRDGAHTEGHNSGTLGVLLLEKVKGTKLGQFDDYYSYAQRISLLALRDKYVIDDICGHNDYAARPCPLFKVNGQFNPVRNIK